MAAAGLARAALAAAALTTAACSADVGGQAVVGGAGQALAGAPAPATTAPAVVKPAAAAAAAVQPPTTEVAPATAQPARPVAVAPAAGGGHGGRVFAARAVTEQEWTPFATAEGLTLVHPSSRVERVGFHESNHDGARSLEPLPTAVGPVTMEGRDRGTAPRSAADVVIDPAVEVRAPVTGTVKRSGTYVLYCRHSDDFVVIAPDGHPGWEVKLLHIDGVQVRRGDRVVAGQTVLAPRPTQLPFESQVDELATESPVWPHVHIEVVDPSVPDRPNPGGGCG